MTTPTLDDQLSDAQRLLRDGYNDRLAAAIADARNDLRDMRTLLARIVNDDPIYDDPENGPFCTFCGKQWHYAPNARPTHADGCTYVAAQALLDRIDGDRHQ